jgi:hypothetical protein
VHSSSTKRSSASAPIGSRAWWSASSSATGSPGSSIVGLSLTRIAQIARPSSEVPIENFGETIEGYVAARRSISAPISGSAS